MEVETHMSVDESEMIAQLFGAQIFQDYNSGIVSCFSPSYYSSNSPQEDTCIGLNWESYSGSRNIDATEINEEPINSKYKKRNCEIDESKLHTCIEVPKKKAHIFKTNAWKENEWTSYVKNHHDSSYPLSENNSTDKSGHSDSTKRREKINERLRTLQKLIPNGTKVDISTMLEEAYQYVKFLQLQIKLLSSDELWMYAPIAFNGINDELSLNISQGQQSGIKMQ